MKHLFAVTASAALAATGLYWGLANHAPGEGTAASLSFPAARPGPEPVTDAPVRLTFTSSLGELAAVSGVGPVAEPDTGSLALRISQLTLLPSAHAQTAPAAPPQGVPVLTVRTVPLAPATLTQRISADGNIMAWQEAVIGAEVPLGRLEKVQADVGSRVRKGEVLAVANADLVGAEVAQLEAAVEEARSALAEASANADRAREVQGSGALSSVQVNQWLSAERAAKARLAAQSAALQAQRVRLRASTVRAPDDGIISARMAAVGAVVPAGMELFRLIRQGRLEWRAEVNSQDLALLRPGQQAEITLPGGQMVRGKVRMLSPVVDMASRRGLVYVDLPESSGARPGLFARGEVQLGESQAQTLPRTAVVLRDGFHWVFVLDAEGRARQTRVEVGRSSGDRIELLGGLPADAQVVESGAGLLADGDRVRLTAAGGATR
jgi:HlyD family secretion protein